MFNILVKLKEATGNKHREQILLENKDNELLKTCFRLAYSNNINFYVKQFENADVHEQRTLDVCLDRALNKLATREITGNLARAYVNNLYNSLTQEDAIVFKRVILGDLECGCSAATANKVWPGLIYTQPQNLCQPFNKLNIMKNIDFNNALVQLKEDGARAFCDISDDVRLYSRAGNEYTGLLRIINAVNRLGIRDVVLDGELLYVPNNTADRSTGNGVMSKALKGTISFQEQNNVVYKLWNITPRDVFYGKAKPTETYDYCFDVLKSLLEGADECLEIVETTYVNSYEEASEIFQQYVANGQEGIILKNRNGLWKNGRSNDQFKFKVEESIDLRVVAANVHSKDDTKLGSLSLASDCGTIKVDVGTGFKDNFYVTKAGVKSVNDPKKVHEYDRTVLWKIRDQVIDTIVQVKANGVVQDSVTGQKSLFLPVFEMIRQDKNSTNDWKYIKDVFGYRD